MGDRLAELRRQVEDCRKCKLWKTRNKPVFGEGPEDAEVLLIGLGPGYYENLEGRPFVGPAGKLLDQLLELVGWKREDVYITNVMKSYFFHDYNTVVGYRVVYTIAVKITDMNLIGQVIDVAADNGANRIQGVSFGLSLEKQAELKMDAYLVALREAEEKALLIAGELEVTITGVLSVSENIYHPYQPYYDYRVTYAGEAAPTTPIIEGKLSVSVTVHVVYSFE